MQANEFDELLRDKYEEYTPAYSEKAWTELAAKIPVDTPVRRSILWLWPVSIGIAASIAMVIVLFRIGPSGNVQHNLVHRQNSPLPSKHNYASAPYQIAHSEPLAIRTLRSNNREAKNKLPTVKANEGITASLFPRPDSASLPVAYSTIEARPQLLAENPVPKRRVLPDEPVLNIEPRIAKKTTVSLAGGVQYGTLNAGYAAGVNIRHQLSKRWSLESDVSYVKYGASGLQSEPVLQTRNASPSSLVASSQTTAPENRPVIQYFQATPGVAFSITNSISIGAAVDLQRNISDNSEETVVTGNADIKTLPLLDIGAAGRAEFGISKRLKAGVIYRYGINNIVQSGHNYLDRRYIQIQLKVPLISR